MKETESFLPATAMAQSIEHCTSIHFKSEPSTAN